MTKQKRNIIAVILCLITLAVAVGIFFTTNKDSPPKDNESEIVSSDVSSNINIEDIENKEDKTVSTKGEIEFIEPDESKADKILEDSKNPSSVSKPAETANRTENQNSKPVTESSELNTFEKGKNELENKALQYLIEHNIDPKTAGETGELCPHCGKKIWNPDKYGSFIPGMPDDYENSGYCLGTCAISFD